jgi:hypothetical protein
MARELTPEEQQELKTLQQVVEKAIADGVLTEARCHNITATMTVAGNVTFETLELGRQLVCDQVNSGGLQAEC